MMLRVADVSPCISASHSPSLPESKRVTDQATFDVLSKAGFHLGVQPVAKKGHDERRMIR